MKMIFIWKWNQVEQLEPFPLQHQRAAHQRDWYNSSLLFNEVLGCGHGDIPTRPNPWCDVKSRNNPVKHRCVEANPPISSESTNDLKVVHDFCLDPTRVKNIPRYHALERTTNSRQTPSTPFSSLWPTDYLRSRKAMQSVMTTII